MLAIQQNQVRPGVIVLDLTGRVCMGRDVQQLEWTVDELLGKQQQHLVINLSKVTHIDSTGIGILVLCAGKVKNAGGELRVAAATGLVDNVLRMTKVDSLVPFFATSDDALQGLKGA